MKFFAALSAFSITPTDTSGHVDTAVLVRLVERISAAGSRVANDKSIVTSKPGFVTLLGGLLTPVQRWNKN